MEVGFFPVWSETVNRSILIWRGIMGDIGGAFEMLLVLGTFGLAFALASVGAALLSLFTPVGLFYSVGAALFAGIISSLYISVKCQ